MTKIVILFALAPFAFTFANHQNARKVPDDIQESWNDVMQPFLTECIARSKVDQVVVDGFLERGEVSNDPCFQCFLKCIGYKTDVIKKDGDLDMERIVQIVAGATREITRECVTRVNSKRDLCAKAYLLTKCVSDALSDKKMLV